MESDGCRYLKNNENKIKDEDEVYSYIMVICPLK